MIYSVIMDGQSIFAYSSDLLLVSPSLTIELNAAGSFSFKMPREHTYYDLPKLMTSDVEVYEQGDLIWYGRVSEIDDTDMNKDKSIYCEGPLAYFNDTVQRPYPAQETTNHDFFRLIVQRHNEYVPLNRQFTIGDITVIEQTITAELDYCTSKDAINQCISNYGGYLIFRKENDVNYVDWIYNLEAIGPQPIQYALNLVSLSKFMEGSGIYTSIIPLGKEVDGAKLTIADVNEGLDYLDSDLIDTYGRITKIVEWSQIGEAEELLQYAEQWLTSQQFNNIRIECDAAELYYLDNSYAPFRVGQLVHVISDPHAVDIYLPITEITINLDSPVKTISIGSEDETEFTGMV